MFHYLDTPLFEYVSLVIMFITIKAIRTIKRYVAEKITVVTGSAIEIEKLSKRYFDNVESNSWIISKVISLIL